MRKVDLAGQSFGRLVVLARTANMNGRTAWRCRCECGAEISIRTESLRGGLSRSCGCLNLERIVERSRTHGRSGTREHRSWSHAKARCLNPNDEKYPIYGGRGITFCERWIHDFAAFLSDMGECPPGYTLDRINVNGPYDPSNCRWIPHGEQQSNKRDTVWVTWDGRRFTLKGLASALGIDYKGLHRRYRVQGRSLNDAVQATRPSR